jgi:hypothetical protein
MRPCIRSQPPTSMTITTIHNCERHRHYLLLAFDGGRRKLANGIRNGLSQVTHQHFKASDPVGEHSRRCESQEQAPEQTGQRQTRSCEKNVSSIRRMGISDVDAHEEPYSLKVRGSTTPPLSLGTVQ